MHIREYRKAAGMTQRELADAIGKTYVTVQSWEKGTTYPNADSLLQMCSLFNCTPNDLLGWYDDHPAHDDPNEQNLVDDYRCADDEGQYTLRVTARAMAVIGTARKTHG